MQESSMCSYKECVMVMGIPVVASDDRLQNAKLDRAGLMALAERKKKKIWEVASTCHRIDLLEGREELFYASNMTGPEAANAFERILAEVSTIDEVAWFVKKLATSSPRLVRLVEKAVGFCATLEQAQRLFSVVPANSKARRIVIFRACKIAPSKEELAKFVEDNI